MSDSPWQAGNPPPDGNGTPPPYGASPPPPYGAPVPPPYGAPVPSRPGGPDALSSDPNYPVVAGFDAPLKVARWRVLGNPIMAIPHLIVLYVLQIVVQVVSIISWLSALFTGRVPEGITTFVSGVFRYQLRVFTFYVYLREPYPSFGIPAGYADPGGDPVWLQVTPAQSYNRLAVLFRIILVIPLYLFVIVLGIGFYVVMIIAFFAVLITGSWPAGLRRYVVGVLFFAARFNCWYFLLVDQYPPFSIS